MCTSRVLRKKLHHYGKERYKISFFDIGNGRLKPCKFMSKQDSSVMFVINRSWTKSVGHIDISMDRSQRSKGFRNIQMARQISFILQKVSYYAIISTVT